ncbi:hypothetical protein [Frisingicoccus sp.]|uniref:hypothetical protein n=1 Tax=Frisingicoccus sp. TaxID=1918627 RepID=UPI003AB15C8B
MEKNRMMRLASALLILTLLTTCMISGTFAKYTTKAEGSDTARVAKWGVTVSTHTDLFATSYTGVDDYNDKVTVKSTDDNKLVAPGTTGTGLGVTSGGTPEVSYEMKIKLDGTTAKMPSLKYTPTGGSEASYEPVKFSVLNGTTPLKENLTLDDLKDLFNGTKVIYKYDVDTKKYYVDSNGDGTIDSTPSDTCPNIKIKWEWAYEGADDNTLYDDLDTILGNTAAAAPGAESINSYSAGAISNIHTDANLTWTVTATQID